MVPSTRRLVPKRYPGENFEATLTITGLSFFFFFFKGSHFFRELVEQGSFNHAGYDKLSMEA